MKKSLTPHYETLTLTTMVGGGQAMGTCEDGRKAFVWGGLPDESVTILVTKKKRSFLEGIVTEVHTPSPHRIAAPEPDSYLSTSPWQIMDWDTEQATKASLIDEAFALSHVQLPQPSSVWSDGRQYGYRNKLELSWWWTRETDTLDLAFFRRGTHGRIPVEGTQLAMPHMSAAAVTVRDVLRARGAQARDLKSLMIREQADGRIVWQLYVKTEDFELFNDEEIARFGDADAWSLVYSNPLSPASITTTVLQTIGDTSMHDTILDAEYTYAVDGFFQVNIPVYEQTLRDMKQWVSGERVIDMYSGVGTIGLSVARDAASLILVEENKVCVEEMQRNIALQGLKNATAILARSELAIEEYITPNDCVIVDPPRAGLHTDVIDRILSVMPPRVIYLSCNPATQARDVAMLLEKYAIVHQQGYNFFPRTPHIEHLLVLDKK
jgi:23S rRNA (uracil1939-C5)-methyltransferase